jgi:hypothetical protein
MTLQSKSKITCLARLVLASVLLAAAWVSAPAQTNTFPQTGNAGAGTTSPDRKLEALDSGSPQLRLTHTDGSVYTDFQTISSGHLLISPTGPDVSVLKPVTVSADSDAFRFFTNADTNLRWALNTDSSGLFHITQKGDGWAGQGTRFSINRSGNVGIGTSNPGAKLHVQRDVNGDNSIYVLNNGGGTSSRSLILLGEAASDAKYSYFGHFGANYAGSGPAQPRSTLFVGADAGGFNLVSYGGASQTGGKISFWTSPDVAGGGNDGVAERMRITSNGNVGIGTLNPVFDANVTRYLALDGGGYFGSIGVGGNITSTSHPVGQYAFFNSGLGGSEKRLATIVGSTDVATNNGKIDFWTTSAGSFGSGPKMSIFSNGNVGINHSSPAYKLDVNGEINATGIRINGTPISGGGTSQWSGTGPIHYTSGNVGVGTATPSQRFHVVESGNNTFAARFDQTHGTASNGLYIKTQTSSSGDIALLVQSGNGATELIAARNSGNVGIGTTTPTERLHVSGNGKVTGNLTVDGTVEGGNIKAKYQDLAEWVPSSEQLSAGTVVVLDTTKSNQVISSTQLYDTRVAGVISAQPGITLGESGEGKVLVATTGRVRVKVDASRGPIQIGDLLVTSDISGVAMKSEAVNLGGVQIHRPGTIIGKALEPLAKGQGEILVLLSLQ